ncbi:MAG: hypothetical protein JO162_05865 [Alphaproteobacteria bacterium]|nr:hypothetical protein [Alphaproteobacteria bacterium]MBV9153058.1 hypothetical protein [Alphaproteobacteria bacterium]MBV9966033.1 hypothetical protein [Alphaproteobacteria bacterium]
MNLSASAAVVILALASPPATGIADCQGAGDAFQAALAKVVNALRGYEQCIASSNGKVKCTAEMQAVDDAQDDFEDAVDEYKKACP